MNPSPLAPLQLTTARIRAALQFCQDVIYDGDLLTPDVRTHVLTALGALAEALAQLRAPRPYSTVEEHLGPGGSPGADQ
jgi:hypothetical protein